jgi:hypothetical protein
MIMPTDNKDHIVQSRDETKRPNNGGTQRLCEPSIVHWTHGHIVKTQTTTIHLPIIVSNVFIYRIVYLC